MKKDHRTWIWIIILSLPSIVHSQSATSDQNISMPPFSALKEGWNTLKPGGETRCAFGTEYSFFVRPANPKKILIAFSGGGGCWDAETCKEGGNIYNQRISPDTKATRIPGILDYERKDNPFSDYTMVYFGTCEGDTYLGNRKVTYQPKEGEAYTVYHYGAINVTAGLTWLFDNIDAPTEIFVAGWSAGGVATPIYANQLAKKYPDSRVTGLSESVGAIKDGTMPDVQNHNHGSYEFVRTQNKWEDFPNSFSMNNIMKFAASDAPNLKLYMVNFNHDPVQLFFHQVAGTKNIRIPSLIRETQAAIKKENPDFKAFIHGGYSHNSLSFDCFYTIKSSDKVFKDWVKDISLGKEVDDVECTNCDYPDFLYTDTDLKVIKRTKELISDKKTWNDKDDGTCKAENNKLSVRCALNKSIMELTRESPTDNTVTWDLTFRAGATIQANRGNYLTSLIDFNNHPDIGHEGIIMLLNQVQEKIESSLNLDARQGN